MKADSLAAALLGASRAWRAMRSGSSLEKALSGVVKGNLESKGAIQSILYATTRRRGALDALTPKIFTRPAAPAVAALVEVSLAQLIAGEESDFTIVDQAVNATKSSPTIKRAASFVNAVLRRFCREKEALMLQLEKEATAQWNAPVWWIEKYKKTFPLSYETIFATQAKHPPMVLRVNGRKTTVEKMLSLLTAQHIQAEQIGESAIYLEKPMAVHLIPGFAEGLVSVQDAGSQLAAEFLSPKNGMRVLDACAAPGGKTAHLAEKANINLTALEIDAKRAERIHENLDRLGLHAEVKVVDAGKTHLWWDGKVFDRILLDAPCTASGIVRRHPDVPWSRQPEDIANLARTQYFLLQAMWPLLARGGRILYAVCSIFPEEGSNQITRFLKEQPSAKLVALMPGLKGMEVLSPVETKVAADGLPRIHDGFFYALLEKN